MGRLTLLFHLHATSAAHLLVYLWTDQWGSIVSVLTGGARAYTYVRLKHLWDFFLFLPAPWHGAVFHGDGEVNEYAHLRSWNCQEMTEEENYHNVFWTLESDGEAWMLVNANDAATGANHLPDADDGDDDRSQTQHAPLCFLIIWGWAHESEFRQTDLFAFTTASFESQSIILPPTWKNSMIKTGSTMLTAHWRWP